MKRRIDRYINLSKKKVYIISHLVNQTNINRTKMNTPIFMYEKYRDEF